MTKEYTSPFWKILRVNKVFWGLTFIFSPIL